MPRGISRTACSASAKGGRGATEDVGDTAVTSSDLDPGAAVAAAAAAAAPEEDLALSSAPPAGSVSGGADSASFASRVLLAARSTASRTVEGHGRGAILGFASRT